MKQKIMWLCKKKLKIFYEKTQAFFWEKLQHFGIKTQRNGSYGSDLNFRTRYFLKFLCSNMASHPKLH